MNEFDRRWQACARRACAGATDAVHIPAGFATRVWARATAPSSTSLAGAWAALSLRALILTSIVLLVCGLTEYYTASAESVLTPHLEDTVVAVWGTL
jgi:hypothetical protein